MKQELEPLKVSALTNVESAQLVKHLLGDVATVRTTLSDAPLLIYLDGLNSGLAKMEPALIQVKKDEVTEKIKVADINRKDAFKALGKAIELGSLSDKSNELDAYHSLSIIYDVHKNARNRNYEGETLIVDALLNDLSAANLAEKVTLLGLQRYIDRLRSTNEIVKSISTDRSTARAQKEIYDTKNLRIDLYAIYDDFIHYVLAMAKAHNNAEFNGMLAIVNATRKLYADMLAKRGGKGNTSSTQVKTDA